MEPSFWGEILGTFPAAYAVIYVKDSHVRKLSLVIGPYKIKFIEYFQRGLRVFLLSALRSVINGPQLLVFRLRNMKEKGTGAVGHNGGAGSVH